LCVDVEGPILSPGFFILNKTIADGLDETLNYRSVFREGENIIMFFLLLLLTLKDVFRWI
jgi:hypothetical protein